VIAAPTLAPPRPYWSSGFAFVVAAIPIAGAIAAGWIEMSEPGETPMWIVAGAFFLICPLVAAAATERAASPFRLRAAIAFALFAVLWGIWILNVPLPTHPGVFATGGSLMSGAVMAGLEALAWLFAASQAAAWIRKGAPVVAFLLGGVILVPLSALAFVVGEFTP